MTYESLVQKAQEAMNRAYAPYSEFTVGAALLCKSGKVYTGCNIENASFSPTVCAERTAFFKAVSEGENQFEKIAVVGGKKGKISDFCMPCGVCRQVMSEFCEGNFEIAVYDGKEIKVFTLSQILPMGFSIEK